MPDQDKTSADSFEATPDPQPVFSHDWGNGVIEYDLASPVFVKPKIYTIKGTLFADSIIEYQQKKDAIVAVLYENYVTLEQVEMGIICNAKLRTGGLSWHRLSNITDPKIIVAVQFQFDEVLQDVPYKSGGSGPVVNEGTITVSYGDLALSVVDGKQRVSIPYWLSGKTNYRIYNTQMNIYFRTEDISYNTAGYFDILDTAFRLKPDNQIIIWPFMLPPVE